MWSITGNCTIHKKIEVRAEHYTCGICGVLQILADIFQNGK